VLELVELRIEILHIQHGIQRGHCAVRLPALLRRAGNVLGMCGRYVAVTPPGVLAEYFAVDEIRSAPPGPSYNVAPTDVVPAVVSRRQQRLLGPLRWGLVPSWSADARGAARMINARAESVTSKPAFRAALARRRCIIPADGFYEWRRDGPEREPWFFRRADQAPMAMAGLWELWRSDDSDEWLRTCAIVTTVANRMVAPVHHRMPVLLEPGDWATWLDADDASTALALLVPADDRTIEAYRVSDRVNSVRNNGPELIEPAAAA
jgi:putative SOS response-associated peptidase YedK